MLVIVVFLIGCVPQQQTNAPENSSAISTEKINASQSNQQTTAKEDFGCFYSCDYFPAGYPKQMCENWKAGKPVQWPSDCKMMQYEPCIKFCESEKKGKQTFNLPPSVTQSASATNKIQAFPSASSTSSDQCSVMASVPDCKYVGSPDSDYYKMCIKCFPDKSAIPEQETNYSGIPKEDPGTENVWIYFTDFKHGRIIRMDDMTGKNWISFGSLGSGVGQFMTPEKFLVQPDGHTYIADPNGNRIVRIDDMTGKGWVSYGSHGIDEGHSRGVGQFNQPHAVRLDAQGRIYIADGGNCRIVRIDDMTGAGWTEYGTGKQCGQSATTIGNTFDIAFDNQGRIYTIDGTDTPRIIRIDDMTGKNWVSYGTKGTDVGQFLEPQSITLDAQGRIYVADEDKTTQGGRIVRIDDMTGKGWTTFPTTDPDSRIRLPHDITISASGKIYIADTRNNGVVRIDDMTGKGYIAYEPYPNAPRGTESGVNQSVTDSRIMEAPKGIFVVEKK